MSVHEQAICTLLESPTEIHLSNLEVVLNPCQLLTTNDLALNIICETLYENRLT